MTLVIYIRENNKDGSPELIADMMKQPAKVFRNKDNPDLFPKDVTNVLRYGCRGNVPVDLKGQVQKTLNTAQCIKTTAHKLEFRRLCVEHCPDAVPETWFNWKDVPEEYKLLHRALLFRGSVHERGNNAAVASVEECIILDEYVGGVGNYYIQDYIRKQKEFRVNFVQGRAVQVLEKLPKDKAAMAWNEANTVNVKWGVWPILVIKKALQVANLSGLYFGCVDVIVSMTDEVYTLEVNTSPELTPYQVKCYAKAFDWSIVNDSFNQLQEPEVQATWQDFIHPALVE